MFCFVPFGGEQNGRKGQETEMEKEYLNMLFYVLEIKSPLVFLKDCPEDLNYFSMISGCSDWFTSKG